MADPGFIWDLVKDASAVVQKGLEYQSTRETLKSTVEDLSPMVENIEQAIKQMDHLPTEHIEKLKEKLAENKEALKKHKIRWYNFFKAPEYKTKLSGSLSSMERFISVQTQLFMVMLLTDIHSLLSSQDHRSLIRSPTNSAHNSFNAGTEIFKDHVDDQPPQFTVGLDGDSMKELKHKLLHGDEQVLNLYGLPGSGKTTMARKLCSDLLVKGKFKSNVIFETLGSHIQGNEVMDKLQDQLSGYGENTVLLVLDDVWPHSENIVDDLHLRLRSPDSRILVTSIAPIRKVETRFPMDLLCVNDAEKLLRHLVRSSDIDFDEPARRKVLLEIVERCEGLPLALQFVGGELRGKDIKAFQKVQLAWSRRGSILEQNMLIRLQNTLHLLADKSIMDCFMDLAVFPQGQKVPVTALIDMWIELYELNEPRSINAIIFINELVAMNLAACIKIPRMVGMDVDNYYNNHFLMQHGLYRELAIRMSLQEPVWNKKRLIIDMYGNPNDPPKWWPKRKTSAVAAPPILSISTDKIGTPDWCNIQAAGTVILVLNLKASEYTLPKFIKGMESLKVLLVTNHGSCKTDLRNLELLGSLLSLKRIRFQQVSIPSLCDLKNVIKLSLYMCDVKEAFENSSIDFSEAMPKLEDLSIEYCKDLEKLPTGLFNVVAMKSLTISSCHKFIGLPEEIEKLENLESLRISYCANVEDVPKSITKLKSLSFLDISFCLSLKKLPEDIGVLHNLTNLYMTGCPVRELPDSIINLEKLESVICDEYAYPSWEVIKSSLFGLDIKIATRDISLNWLT